MQMRTSLVVTAAAGVACAALAATTVFTQAPVNGSLAVKKVIIDTNGQSMMGPMYQFAMTVHCMSTPPFSGGPTHPTFDQNLLVAPGTGRTSSVPAGSQCSVAEDPTQVLLKPIANYAGCNGGTASVTTSYSTQPVTIVANQTSTTTVTNRLKCDTVIAGHNPAAARTLPNPGAGPGAGAGLAGLSHAAIAGIIVSLVDRKNPRATPQTFMSDGSGTFSFGALMPSTYEFTVDGPSLGRAISKMDSNPKGPDHIIAILIGLLLPAVQIPNQPLSSTEHSVHRESPQSFSVTFTIPDNPGGPANKRDKMNFKGVVTLLK